ncbi:DAK2 domain-containing protein [Sulfobacillus thermotolerans]|uniref:DAK2 domain-containing protein n=1 Tax=Sulfobacillus thermotolerans TaxID=338644 RepID=UPI003D2FE057
MVGDKTIWSSLAQDAELAHAKEWAEATASLQAKKGRAAYLGARSVGHIDPGATSSALWWQCLGRIIGGSV